MARGGKRPGAGRKPGQKGHSELKNTDVFILKPGRPSSYDPSYCEDIVEFCKQGFSLTAFAGAIGVCRDTLSEWARVHEAFSVAVSRAKAARLLHWESAALKVATRGGGPGTATMIVFGLKNMGGAEWSDTTKTEVSGPNGGPIQHETSARDVLAGKLARLSPGQGSAGGSSEPDGSPG